MTTEFSPDSSNPNRPRSERDRPESLDLSELRHVPKFSPLDTHGTRLHSLLGNGFNGDLATIMADDGIRETLAETRNQKSLLQAWDISVEPARQIYGILALHGAKLLDDQVVRAWIEENRRPITAAIPTLTKLIDQGRAFISLRNVIAIARDSIDTSPDTVALLLYAAVKRAQDAPRHPLHHKKAVGKANVLLLSLLTFQSSLEISQELLPEIIEKIEGAGGKTLNTGISALCAMRHQWSKTLVSSVARTHPLLAHTVVYDVISDPGVLSSKDALFLAESILLDGAPHRCPREIVELRALGLYAYALAKDRTCSSTKMLESLVSRFDAETPEHEQARTTIRESVDFLEVGQLPELFEPLEEYRQREQAIRGYSQNIARGGSGRYGFLF